MKGDVDMSETNTITKEAVEEKVNETESKNAKYVDNRLAWGLIIGTFVISIAVALIVILSI